MCDNERQWWMSGKSLVNRKIARNDLRHFLVARALIRVDLDPVWTGVVTGSWGPDAVASPSSRLGGGGERSQVAVCEWEGLWKKTWAASDTKRAFRERGATSGGKPKYQPINHNTLYWLCVFHCCVLHFHFSSTCIFKTPVELDFFLSLYNVTESLIYNLFTRFLMIIFTVNDSVF